MCYLDMYVYIYINISERLQAALRDFLVQVRANTDLCVACLCII